MPALSKTSQIWLVLVLVLALRLPFLNQAIQGDDFYYLKGAEHALIDPLHPAHARYVFQGEVVDMRGHPHPPLNAAYLGALVALLRGEPEVPLHLAYILFSVIAGFSALAISRKFTNRPVMATVLFLVTPAFVVNGNSLESDLPFVAFWLASIAFFIYDRWWLATAAGMIAAISAYQAIILAPVLGFLLWRDRRRDVPAWIAALAAPATVAAWQLYERWTGGALPATVLAGYMQTYNLQAFAQKLKNAGALTGHMAWLVFPVLALVTFWRGPRWMRAVAAAVMAVAAVADHNPLFWISCGIGSLIVLSSLRSLNDFPCWWAAVFFASALVLFFAGSQRYLLPIVLPVAILVSRNLDRRWLLWGAALEAVLSVGLAFVNYQHWGAYRQFARSLAGPIRQHRTWTNAEWGFRHYLEAEGAMPLVNGQGLWPGDMLVTTSYGAMPPHTGPSAIIAERVISSAIPLRIVGMGVDSAYSSISFGLAPFAISTAPIDRIRAAVITERKAELAALTIGSPEAERQIVSGIYNTDRWTSGRATVILKHAAGEKRIEAKVFIPPQSPARTLRLYADGKPVAEQTYNAPGAYTLEGPAPVGDVLTVSLEVDRTFSVPGDARELGVLLLSIGLR